MSISDVLGSSTSDESSATEAKGLPASLEALYLASSKFIQDLKPQDFQELYAQIEWVLLKPKQVLFRAGEDHMNAMLCCVVRNRDEIFDSARSLHSIRFAVLWPRLWLMPH